jgi:hypothetical protein
LQPNILEHSGEYSLVRDDRWRAAGRRMIEIELVVSVRKSPFSRAIFVSIAMR